MFDTPVTVVGNVITTPEWRRTTNTGTLVAHFKVASNSRKFDRHSGKWVDGNSLRVRVTCWRRLAGGVASSVMVGDPVLVTGRMYSRDWSTEDGQRRVSYELEAIAVGHDLSRGQATFVRNRGALATSAVEDVEADTRVAGEPTTALLERSRATGDERPDPDEPVGPHFDDYEEVDFDASVPGLAEAAAIMRKAMTSGPGTEDDDTDTDTDADADDEAEDGADAAEGSRPTPEPEVEPETQTRRGGRRGRSRVAAPA